MARLMDFSRERGIPLTFRSGGTSLNGQGQGDGILVDSRHHWRGVEVLEEGAGRSRPAGHDPRPRQPRADSARPQARPRSGLDRHRDDGRGARQQLRRDALRDDQGHLLDAALAALRAAVGNDDRHRRARRSRALRRRRARARRRPGGDPGRDPRRRRSARADPAQVRDQEHDRLPALCLPRRRRAARDLPAPARRLRGHARVRLRGDARDGAAAAEDDDRLGPLPRHREGRGPGRRSRRRGSDRGRADGGAGVARRRALDSRDARVLEGARPGERGAADRVRGR